MSFLNAVFGEYNGKFIAENPAVLVENLAVHAENAVVLANIPADEPLNRGFNGHFGQKPRLFAVRCESCPSAEAGFTIQQGVSRGN
jgi:hypothetical protein